MGILEDIEKMDDVIKQVVIDKFLNINITEQKCSLDNEKITTEVILKEKENNKQSYIKYIIFRNKIDIHIMETHYSGGNNHYYSSNSDYVKLKLEVKIPNVFNLFLSSENKKIKNKIQELFEYKTNETTYKNLKYVIDNQLNSKELRKMKLQEIESLDE